MHVIVTTHSHGMSGGVRQALYQIEELARRGIRTTVVIREESAIREYIPKSIPVVVWEEGIFNAAQAIKSCIAPEEPTIIHSYHSFTLKILSFWGMLWKMEFPNLRCVAHRGVSSHPVNPFPFWATGIDCFIPNSTSIAKQIRHFIPYSKRVAVVHNGIPKERIIPNIHSDIIAQECGLTKGLPVISSIINASPRKGGKELLLAFEQLDTKAELLLIGVDSAFVEQHIQNAEVLERIHTLITEDVANYLQCSSFFVFPSTCFDSLPNVIIEAMGIGLPIIATNVGGTKELIRKNGKIIPPKDVHALKNAMEYALHHPKVLREWSAQSKEHFEHFTIAQRVDTLLKIYTKLLQRPTGE